MPTEKDTKDNSNPSRARMKSTYRFKITTWLLFLSPSFVSRHSTETFPSILKASRWVKEIKRIPLHSSESAAKKKEKADPFVLLLDARLAGHSTRRLAAVKIDTQQPRFLGSVVRVVATRITPTTIQTWMCDSRFFEYFLFTFIFPPSFVKSMNYQVFLSYHHTPILTKKWCSIANTI